jgi:hypothetical protein
MRKGPNQCWSGGGVVTNPGSGIGEKQAGPCQFFLFEFFGWHGQGQGEVIANGSPGSQLFCGAEKSTVQPALQSHSTIAGGYGVAQTEARHHSVIDARPALLNLLP